MIDLHNHILPDLDDGAQDWSEALEMAKTAKADGISAIVCTPHWVSCQYENSADSVVAKVHQLRELLWENDVDLALYPGTELRLDPSLKAGIDRGQLLTINDNARYALIELPMYVPPGGVEPLLDQLFENGVVPIIAHPERYLWTPGQLQKLASWVRRGMLMQLTAASLLGHFGRDIEHLSIQLLKLRLVHVLATDSHGLKMRSPKLSEALDKAASIIGPRLSRRLVADNPRRIVAGLTVHSSDPLPVDSPRPKQRVLHLFRKARALLEKLKGRSS